LVVCRATERGEFRLLGGGGARQRLAGRVVLRRHAQLLHQRQRLVVHRGVVARHLLGERAHLRVVRFLQRLFCRSDVDVPGGVGNVRDLRVVDGGRRRGGVDASHRGGDEGKAEGEGKQRLVHDGGFLAWRKARYE